MKLDEPLKPTQAKSLIREILSSGEVIYSKPHAEERLRKWNLTTVDCVNVLRGGAVAEGNTKMAVGDTRFTLREYAW